MHPSRRASTPRPWRASNFAAAVVFTLVLLAGPRPVLASSITSSILIDPEGEFTGDFYGCSVAWIGDVNVDGFDDLLVGAFRYPEIASHGKAYLYFGGPAIDSTADLVLLPPPGNVAWFGVSVASAGDFNGDGFPDFIIGAQQSGYEGKAFLYHGGPALDATSDVTLTGESTGALTSFGQSVASAGDVNGDGFGDVIVGAPLYGNRPGRAYVFFGGALPDTVADRVFTGAGFNDQLGSVVGSAGDMNGDGHGDVFASSVANIAGAPGAGAINVWFGGPAFDTTPDLTLLGTAMNERLINAANAGDINADGYSDLIGAGRDHVYAWFGGPSPNAVPDLVLGRTYASVAGAGDVSGDGIDDFVIGTQYGTDVAGRVSVFFGGSAVDTLDDMHFLGDASTGAIGVGVAGGGHVDGPGPADLATSAYWDPESIGYNKGRVLVIGNSFTPTGVPAPSQLAGFRFSAPRPNPARNEVNLLLELDRAVPVAVRVYDLAGREVARPIEGERLVGLVRRTWRPSGLPGGVYYVRATLGDREQVHRLVWLGDRQ